MGQENNSYSTINNQGINDSTSNIASYGSTGYHDRSAYPAATYSNRNDNNSRGNSSNNRDHLFPGRGYRVGG